MFRAFISANRFRLYTISLILALTFTACSSGPRVVQQSESAFFGTSKVQRFKLKNGLRILVLEDHSSPTFAYHVWYNVGSRDEEKGLTGLAHLFEHMMFKETKNLKEGEFDRLLESAGAEGENAFTSRDYTGYIQSLPKERLDLVSRLEAERMTNLVINEKALDTEREVVQNERRFRKENNPDGQLYERLYELAYTKHPYHWPVIGYAEDLERASKKDAESFYKRFYAPNNATVVVVGDVDASEVVRVVDKHFGKIPPSKIDSRTRPIERPLNGERIDTKPAKIAVEKLMIAYRIPNVKSEAIPVLEIIRNVLVGGKGSRLYRKLVDAGVATDVDIANVEHADPGLFMFFVNMQKGKTAKQALRIINNEVRNVMAGRVKPAEISRAVSMLRFSTFDGLTSNYRKAYFLGFYETVAGGFERGVEIVNSLSTITPKTVARTAKKYLKNSNRVVVIGVPQGAQSNARN